MLPKFLNNYIGLPFLDHGRTRTSLDCWGLVRLFYKEQYNISLPSYLDYSDTKDLEAIKELVVKGTDEASQWVTVVMGEEKLGDVVILSYGGNPVHVGVVVDKGWMLHIEKGIDSCLERFTSPKWIKRLHCLYRHKSRM